MPHQRAVIRRAVVALLKAAGTSAGLRIYPNRVLPVGKKQMPAILVRSGEESVDPASSSTSPRELTRSFSLEIVALCGVEEDADDVLDGMALEIETAMHADPFLRDSGGRAQAADLVLSDTSEPDIDREGDRLIGGIALTYTVTYQTLAPEPPTDLDDFVTAHVTHKVTGPSMPDADDAEDEFTVQEEP